MELPDPKRVELGRYDGLAHLVLPVARGAAAAAAESVTWLAGELERRITAFEQVGARDLRRTNRRAAEPLSLLLAAFDELVDLVYQ